MPEDDSDIESEDLQPSTPSPIQLAARAMHFPETTPNTVMEEIEDAPAEVHASSLNEIIDFGEEVCACVFSILSSCWSQPFFA